MIAPAKELRRLIGSLEEDRFPVLVLHVGRRRGVYGRRR